MHKGELKFTCTRRRTCRSIGFVDDRQRMRDSRWFISGGVVSRHFSSIVATRFARIRERGNSLSGGGVADGRSTSRNAILEDSHGKYTYVWNSLSLSLLAGNAWEKRVHFSFFCKKKRQFVSLRRNGILIIGTQGRGGKNLHFSKISHLPPPFFLSIPFSGFFFSFSFF